MRISAKAAIVGVCWALGLAVLAALPVRSQYLLGRQAMENATLLASANESLQR